MREVEATLECGLAVGLRKPAEDVLAVDAEVAGDRVRLRPVSPPPLRVLERGGLRLRVEVIVAMAASVAMQVAEWVSCSKESLVC